MTETPTGFRDYWPIKAQRRKQFRLSLERLFESYGFQPMEESSVEFLHVLTAKSGEAIKDEIFRIEGEEIGLRFDLTVGLGRALASNLDVHKPFKRYLIDRVWRNEEPQRGRYREFIQADVDIIGVGSPTAEVELLTMGKKILEHVGMPYVLLLNDRHFLESFAKKEGFEERRQEVFRIMDKLDKIGKEAVLEQLANLLTEAALSRIEELISLEGKAALDFIRDYDPDAGDGLEFIQSYVKEVRFAPYLIRGFDYYTGPIFEFKHKTKEGLTVIGGGRYDHFLELYGKGDYAVGMGVGFDRILALEEGKAFQRRSSTVYVVAFKGKWELAFSTAEKLRKAGLDVDMDYGERSLKKQLEYADSKAYPFVVFVGEKEASEGKIKLRNMKTGEEKLLSQTEAVDELKKELEYTQ